MWQVAAPPTSCCPLLAQSRQTGWGVTGTDVRILRPPISHTFWTAQSSWEEHHRERRTLERERERESTTETEQDIRERGERGRERQRVREREIGRAHV